MCVSCGQFDASHVTHCVSAVADTGSVRKALAHGLHAVSPQWLHDTYLRWARQEERLYSHATHEATQLALRRTARASAALATTEQRVARACALVKSFLGNDAQFTPSQRLSVAIRFLAPGERRTEANTQIARFEAANGTDAAAAEDALEKIVEIVGGHTSLDHLVRELAPPTPAPV